MDPRFRVALAVLWPQMGSKEQSPHLLRSLDLQVTQSDSQWQH